MIVSLYQCKVEKAIRRISKDVHLDLYHRLLEADRQTLTLTLEQEVRLRPDMHFLHEEDLIHFWALPEEEAVVAPHTKEYVVMKSPALHRFSR